MLNANTPAFLKMLVVAAILEKRQLPAFVRLPVVGGGGLIYTCQLPQNFLAEHPLPLKDAPRAKWRTFAYEVIAQIEFQLNDIQTSGWQG
jgi:hypothetical protein